MTRNNASGIRALAELLIALCFFGGSPAFHCTSTLSRYPPFWRVQDDVASDIRACVDFVRKQYKPTSLGLMGFCYGGGRALEEAAAGNRLPPKFSSSPSQ